MRNVRGEMWKDLNIADLPRLSRFPFPVQSLGYTHGGIYPERTYHYERFEVCIRRYSQALTAAECVNGTAYRVKFPNVIMKSPGTVHTFGVELPRDVVHFTYAAEMEAALRSMLPFPEKPVWEIHLGTKENQLITELMDLMEKPHEFGVTDRIDLAAFQLLELLIFSYNYSILRPDYYETRIRSIASYFQLHYKEEIDIVKLTAHYGMSRSTFLRHWQRFFRKTPGQYLLDLKLQEACRLLQEDHSLSVSDLTFELGFRESAYFCSLFRKKFGMTPLQFRHHAKIKSFQED